MLLLAAIGTFAVLLNDITYAAFHWAREVMFTRLNTVPNPTHQVMKLCLQVVDWRKQIVLPLIPNMADDGALKGKQIRNFVLYY